jgi:hypothetical protein
VPWSAASQHDSAVCVELIRSESLSIYRHARVMTIACSRPEDGIVADGVQRSSVVRQYAIFRHVMRYEDLIIPDVGRNTM